MYVQTRCLVGFLRSAWGGALLLLLVFGCGQVPGEIDILFVGEILLLLWFYEGKFQPEAVTSTLYVITEANNIN